MFSCVMFWKSLLTPPDIGYFISPERGLRFLQQGIRLFPGPCRVYMVEYLAVDVLMASPQFSHIHCLVITPKVLVLWVVDVPITVIVGPAHNTHCR